MFHFFLLWTNFINSIDQRTKIDPWLCFGVWTMDYGDWAMAPLLRSQG